MPSTDSLVRIASAGGSLIISTSSISSDSFVRIASTLKESCSLTITNASGISTDSAVRIASACKNGNVIFDYSK